MRAMTWGMRNLAFGAAVLAALGFGVSSAGAAPMAQGEMRLCGKETSEGGCQSCCAYYGYDYGWDDELGCACNPW